MPNTRELPQLTSELVDMTKTYLRQETVEPARKLGKTAGLTLAAGALFALGAALLSVVIRNVLVDLLPDGPFWAALGLGIAAIVVLAVAGGVMWGATRNGTDDGSNVGEHPAQEEGE